MSAREVAIAALAAKLGTLAATVMRGEVLPAAVPDEGLVIVRDGDAGEPEATLSPLSYLFHHRAEIEVVVAAATGEARAAALDALLAAIAAMIEGDRTLNGAVEWAEPGPPEIVEIASEGAAPLKAARVPVTLVYSSPSALA